MRAFTQKVTWLSFLLVLLTSFGIFSVSTAAAEDEEGAVQPEDCIEGDLRRKCQVDEITVTGSRIKRDEFTSLSPITIITAERSALAGLLDTGDILQGSTIAAGQQIDDSFSGFVTDGGPGANSVSLRGLGAQRTLILVNGKRFGPSGVQGSVNSVDTSGLPSSIISRVEILKDGASSIYGADAVAGVINIITKERQDGLQINATGLLGDTSGGQRYGVDGVWGKIGDDWSFNVAADYVAQQQLKRDQRGYASCDIRPRKTDQDGGGTIDNRDPATGEELCFGFIYGLATSPFGFVRYDGSLDPTTTAANPNFDETVNGAFGIPFFTTIPETALDNSGAFYRDDQTYSEDQIIPDNESFSVTAFADKDLNLFDRTSTAFLEFFYNKRVTTQNRGFAQFFPLVSRTHPDNPFGLNGPLAGFGGFEVQPVIPTYNLRTNNDFKVEVERFNIFAGLKGDLTENWSYETHLGYSKSDGSYASQQFLQDRVDFAVGIDPNTGAPLTGGPCVAEAGSPVAANVANGCVTANLFTEDALLNGNLPADFLNYIRKDTLGNTTYETVQVSGFVTGTLFELWNEEEVQGVFGFDYRSEEINDVPDSDAQLSNFWGFSTAGITAGDDTVSELYAEVEFPLAKNTQFADELTLNISGRYTDYDSYGDDTTYRGQLNWQINPLVRLRTSIGTSFRAPDLYEQFLGDQTGFSSGFNDPCIDYGTNFEPGSATYENCASLGLPTDFGTQGAPSITAITGGASDLFAETSDARTVGIILTPEDLGISLSINMFEIEVNNTVASPSVGYITGTCYDDVGFTNGICDRIGPRDAQGFISFVDSSAVNIGVERTQGVDIDFIYEKEFASWSFTTDLTMTNIREQYFEVFGDEFNVDGNWSFPDWSGQLDLYADWRDWRFQLTVDYIGNSKEDPVFDPGTSNVDRFNETPATFYHTFGARYTSPNKWQVIATVANIFDEQPPIVSDSQGSESGSRVFNTLPGSGYDLYGRRFVLQVSKGF